MRKINDGGPAYYPDMSLRDYVAARAFLISISTMMPLDLMPGDMRRRRLDAMSEISFDVANAFIAARAKGGDADG